MKAGQGFSGKKTINAQTMFNQLFEVADSDPKDEEIDEFNEPTGNNDDDDYDY
jgi:hypothetical protein